MSFSRYFLITGACLAALAASAAPARKQSFEAFPMVRTRNIFDPERQPGVTPSAAVDATRTTPATSSDYSALTGTMITAHKTIAFFSGSRPEWGGVLAVGASIAGAKLTKITSAGVEVVRDGKTITIAVGQTVPLTGNAVPTAAPASVPVAASSSLSLPPANPASSPVPGPDREALIRRMMEKRQQELK